ncbi:MAG: HAD family hydrolase [Deltaproteobacteria bacterium]|nr:HAD family hydrolase [Deltaproteobacteria bacterium]
MIGNYRHIIWDWNGALVDDLALNVAIVNTMLSQRGMAPVTHDQYRELITFPIQEFYRSIGFDFDREPFEQLAVEFIRSYKSGWHQSSLHLHSRKILEHVRAMGRSQSVLSANHRDTLREYVATFGIVHLFEHLVGLDNFQATSKVAEGRQLLDRLPHDATEILLVGDTLHDAEVADAIGVDCVLVAHGYQSRQRLEQSGRPIIDSLSELMNGKP